MKRPETQIITAISGHNKQQGFTLIELSIVLVIIGLIVGGVLVGQDLIKAAQVRAAISQIEKYDSAVNTFRTKYNGLPGDLNNATNFFPTATDNPVLATCTKYNPGNNVFDDCATGAGGATLSGEPAAFWHHLYLSSLIGDAMTDNKLIGGAALAAPGSIANAFPASKVGSGNYVMAYTGNTALVEPGMAGTNLYRIAGIASFTAGGAPTFTNSLTPLEAFAIDSKKDDGIPNTGVVQATDATAAANFNVAADTTTVAAGNCVAVAGAYNTAAQPNSRLCQVVMRTSF